MREIKFRAWDGKTATYPTLIGRYGDSFTCWHEDGFFDTEELEQFTGLHDKNGLIEVYEGDIIDTKGEVYANIHERKEQRSTDFIVEGMGTSKWRHTEQEAIRRGCKYAE